MILTDAGPLVALLDANDSKHRLCVAALNTLPAEPMLTTWPCFTEAMYLLGNAGGHRYQIHLWEMFQVGKLQVHVSTGAEMNRMAHLMEKYSDLPMDLGDASLIACAEMRYLKRIFSLDRDFYIYRLADGSTLEMVHFPSG